MLKCKGSSKGAGGSKSKSKGTGSDTVVKTKKLQTAHLGADLVTLRNAIRNEDGTDKASNVWSQRYTHRVALSLHDPC